ncbi:FadR/GntR family transcriptional regulator [Pelagibius litoralis]|uniref:FadR/GntR family transcriptional regulator n=1 Tax=Pelagibius litoralis TaxID=374515 RepID=UPI002AC3388D|nr:FadR/GntR family transcriptional regulator [Pelagibius litoralis]
MSGTKPASKTYSKRSLHGLVAHDLGLRIVGGELPSDTLLPNEADLSALLKVSRTALREAIKVLAAKGLLVSKPKVGTRVRSRAEWNMLDPDILAWHFEAAPYEDFVRGLFEMRQIIEPSGAAMAAQRRSKTELAAIRAAYEAMERAPSGSDAVVETDLRFHQAILNASDNQFMGSLGSLIETALLGSFRLSSASRPDAHVTSLPGHKAVLDAIERRDPEAARSAMRELLRGAKADVLAVLKLPQKKEPAAFYN